MVDKKTNQPHGYGRLITTDNDRFIDGQFNYGDRHGYTRWIE